MMRMLNSRKPVQKFRTLGIIGFEGQGLSPVVLSNGSRIDCDVIINCVGFKTNFSFLPEAVNRKFEKSGSLHLFARIFDVDMGKHLAMVGFARPGIGNAPSINELQARYIAQVASGKQLPSKDAMLEEVGKWRE